MLSYLEKHSPLAEAYFPNNREKRPLLAGNKSSSFQYIKVTARGGLISRGLIIRCLQVDGLGFNWGEAQ